MTEPLRERIAEAIYTCETSANGDGRTLSFELADAVLAVLADTQQDGYKRFGFAHPRRGGYWSVHSDRNACSLDDDALFEFFVRVPVVAGLGNPAPLDTAPQETTITQRLAEALYWALPIVQAVNADDGWDVDEDGLTKALGVLAEFDAGEK